METAKSSLLSKLFQELSIISKKIEGLEQSTINTKHCKNLFFFFKKC